MSKHPVLESFGKWLAWQILFDMIVWIFLAKWNPIFIQILLSSFGSNGISFFDFFGFIWFIFTMGSFIGLVIWPSMPKRSYLR